MYSLGEVDNVNQDAVNRVSEPPSSLYLLFGWRLNKTLSMFCVLCFVKHLSMFFSQIAFAALLCSSSLILFSFVGSLF